jgi:hypothetical protein
MPNRNGFDRRSTNQNKFRNETPIPNQIFVRDDVTHSIAREGGLSTPNLLSAEMWLLQGGGRTNINLPTVVATSSPSSKHSIPPPMSKPQHQQQHRGRSPNHRSPTKQSSSARNQNVCSKNTSSLSPLTFASNEQVSPSSVLPSKGLASSRSCSKKNTTSMNYPCAAPFEKSKDIASSSVCPIPPIYISYIRKAFGDISKKYSNNNNNNSTSCHRPIDLYTEVLGLPHQQHPYTDTQIRVAYFRQGRLALRQSSSPNSSIIYDPDAITNVMPSKQVFQAISKAYEIVTNPHYKAYYETYGLPPLKPDAPTSVDIIQRDQSPHHPTQATAAKNSTAPRVVSSRCIDPEEDDRNDDCHTNPTRFDDSDNHTQSVVLDEYADDIGSVVSMSSILRNNKNDKNRQRSKSWGPAASSSSSRQRVVWKEMVQELIYQPDPPSNQSIEMMEEQQRQQQLDAQSYMKLDDVTSGAPPSSSMTRLQQEIEDRDFLDDLEASVDGIGETIGNFVKYLSEKNASNHSIVLKHQSDDSSTAGSERMNLPRAILSEEKNSPQANCQLFKNLPEQLTSNESEKVDVKKFIPVSDSGGAYAKRIAEYHRRSHSCDDKTYLVQGRCKSITATAPLKEGKADQEPRIKPKKSKRKKVGVDKVPSNMTDAVNGTNSDYDVFDPFQHSIDTSVDFGAIDPLIDAWKTRASPSDCCVHNPITPNKSTVLASIKFDSYELPEVSSILASLDGGTDATPTLNLDAEKSMSFDDALNRTTDATTKGYIRLDRRANSLSAVSNRVPSLDVSEITHSSNVSDDPAGRHFHFAFLTSLTQSAKATIKEIASFDEENGDKVNRTIYANDVPTTSTTQHPSTPSSNVSCNPPDNVDLFSQFNTFMQSFVEDMNKLGTQISTNLIETNRVVRDHMTFPETEVSGFLERVGTELHFTKSTAPNTDHNNDLHQSFTY